MLRIVLIKPTHPGNIGAAARAMKVMGVESLYLVAPSEFPSAVATDRASSAADILENATVVPDLLSAIADCELVYGSGSDVRDAPWKTLSPKKAAEHLAERSADREVAVVFGTERSGMTNEELMLCQGQIQIPTGQGYHSLNLAAAVQIICYEYLLATQDSQPAVSSAEGVGIDRQKREVLYRLIESLATQSGYLNQEQLKQFPQKIRVMIDRLALSARDADLLLGFCRRILRCFK